MLENRRCGIIASNILARPGDDACAFDAEIVAAEAAGALCRHGFNSVVLRPPLVIDGAAFDVSAFVLPVLDTDVSPAATLIQLAVGGDGVLLAAERYNLLRWKMTRVLRLVLASVRQDVHTISGEMRRAADGGP